MTRTCLNSHSMVSVEIKFYGQVRDVTHIVQKNVANQKFTANFWDIDNNDMSLNNTFVLGTFYSIWFWLFIIDGNPGRELYSARRAAGRRYSGLQDGPRGIQTTSFNATPEKTHEIGLTRLTRTSVTWILPFDHNVDEQFTADAGDSDKTSSAVNTPVALFFYAEAKCEGKIYINGTEPAKPTEA
ncbi:hypothetical protein BJ138DRAFT_1108046 [Hygrophoropsis aurantiaca]|uniref:Uncharacterized protein n=1 Tax=Hygrophoropsis aurantiaca TaxID=72124 RepID=A0ACB7ZQM4_9AGAM|nr:hypothetical protein BJ138DRAFT_1108046 [Hygrophoropsis aurantiaca]